MKFLIEQFYFRDAFRCIDLNGDGKVSSENLLKLLMNRHDALEYKQAHELIKYEIFLPASRSSGNTFVSGAGGPKLKPHGRSNRTQCCQRLATTATFFRKKPCCPGAMTRRWGPQTRSRFGVI